jgi:hypothetical protein
MTINYNNQSQSYRRGYVEAETGERNAYLLEAGATDIEEYNRGFDDRLAWERLSDELSNNGDWK